MPKKYRVTLFSCYLCFIIQAIVNNLSPLLFVTYSREFSISTSQITLLVFFNFIVQMFVDILGIRYADRIGHRLGMLIAHFCSFVGLVGFSLFTSFMPPFSGLLLATFFCAVGSGFIEVMASPMVEALPLGEKSSAMSLLHSFYCWGHIAIVLLCTLFFTLSGVGNWRYLTLIWAAVPLMNGILFAFIPLMPLKGDEEGHTSARKLFSLKGFILFLILMICAGAMEQTFAQWSSLFAELGLGVDKTVGDLLGTCFFALMMAISRTAYGIIGSKLDLSRTLKVCAVGVFASVLLTVFSPIPALSLVGCGLAGLFVGVYWPGSLSLASGRIPLGGTTMFAALALGGDVGCSLGPAVVGVVSDTVGGSSGLKSGILCAAVFPIAAYVLLKVIKRMGRA